MLSDKNPVGWCFAAKACKISATQILARQTCFRRRTSVRQSAELQGIWMLNDKASPHQLQLYASACMRHCPCLHESREGASWFESSFCLVEWQQLARIQEGWCPSAKPTSKLISCQSESASEGRILMPKLKAPGLVTTCDLAILTVAVCLSMGVG